MAVIYLFGIYTLISFRRLWGSLQIERNAEKWNNWGLKQSRDHNNEYSYATPNNGNVTSYLISEGFSCFVAYIKLGPKWNFLGTLYCWLDHWWSQIFDSLLSYCSEMLPSEVVNIVASSGTECLGTEVAPTELHRAALSCFVTANTNGPDFRVCFSVNHSLPAWCVSPRAIGMITQPPQ